MKIFGLYFSIVALVYASAVFGAIATMGANANGIIIMGIVVAAMTINVTAMHRNAYQ